MAPKKSVAWDHFVDKGDYIAGCKICKANISFKSGVTNLIKHIHKNHIAINLVTEPTEPQQKEHLQDMLDEDIKPQLSPQPSKAQTEHTITINDKMQKKSVAWDYFVDKGNYKGECNICKANISFKSGVSNLTKHVQKVHNISNLVTEDTETQQEQYLLNSSDEELQSFTEVEYEIINSKPKRSIAWSYFVDKGDYIGQCNLCKTNISFKSGVSNLTKHVQRVHHTAFPTRETEPQQEEYLQDSSDEDINTPKSPHSSTPRIRHSTTSDARARKKSVAWDFFVKKDDSLAICKICNTCMSYKSGVTNLTKHIKRKHPNETSETQEIEPQQDSTDEEMPQSSTACTKSSASISEFLRFDRNKIKKESSSKRSIAWKYFIDKGNFIGECNICKANISFKSGVSNLTKHVQRHTVVSLSAEETELQEEQSTHDTSDEEISPQQSPQSTSMRKDINNHIMNLFIWDNQPFSIVEDKGFRALINFAFPNYDIPTRNYFSSTELMRHYKAVKISTKATVKEDAESICLTVDIWTSKNNDSYLVVMGYYIDKNFVLQSVLLECKVLENNLLAAHLARELQNIVLDWNILDKVLLIVSDNSVVIKEAIMILSWKHFICYKHTLNIAVQNALESAELVNVINKVKAIISDTHIQKNSPAWNTLKKYLEKLNKTMMQPNRDVAAKWIYTLCMLRGFVELKDEITYDLSNTEEISMSFTSYEWSICESLILVLLPCEEVSKEIIGQKYFGGSSVLPITVGLTNALEIIIDPLFPDEVETCRQDLSSEITTRFSNVENSRTFTVSTFLDPRFKFYFGNPAIAEQTKRHVIGLLTGIISIESDESDSHLTSKEESETVGKRKTNLLWNHYHTTMKKVCPVVTANNRASIEVERYLDDTVIVSLDLNPLDWWRSNQTTYPYLAKLARIKLNTMATSAPCERLFTAVDNVTERKNLTSKKMLKLLFLQQNKK